MGDFCLEIQIVFSRSHCTQYRVKTHISVFLYAFWHYSAQSPPTGVRGGFLYSWLLKTQCAKFWPNLNLEGGEGGLFLATQNSMCQVLTKFKISMGWGSGVEFLAAQNSKVSSSDQISWILATQNTNCQLLTKFSFWVVGGGEFLATQNSQVRTTMCAETNKTKWEY